MKYNYIVINTEGYRDYVELQKTLNNRGESSYHIVATFGRLIIMEQEEEE